MSKKRSGDEQRRGRDRNTKKKQEVKTKQKKEKSRKAFERAWSVSGHCVCVCASVRTNKCVIKT